MVMENEIRLGDILEIMLYEKDGKIYLVNSRQETTGGMDHE